MPAPLTIEPNIRINAGRAFAFGPGKASLLEHIAATGSIREAAAAMGMSYMRAWTIARSLEKAFPEPLIVKSRGGASGGGAHLTDTGREVLRLYRDMEGRAREAVATHASRLQKILEGSPPRKQ
jgi:molybdate transport system regulatory protein